MTRRDLLLTSSAVPLLRAQGKKYSTALIGTGWWGMNILGEAMASGQCSVAALCDVDENQINPALEKVRKLTSDQPRLYRDYGEMLAKEKPEICIVATPDHWHSLCMIEAVKSGAHVYVEKPICHTINEGKAMVKAARAANRVVQVGVHRRVSPHNLSAREFIRSGKAGKIGSVRAFVNNAGGPGQKVPDSDPPKGLDWNMWLGPAPDRAYNKTIHPRGFRQYLEYANGTNGDWGIHWFDQIRWILDLQAPTRVYSSMHRRILQDSTDAPDTQTATMEFDNITVQWEHRRFAGNNAENHNVGVYFFGVEGTFHLGWTDGWTFYPADRKKPPLHEQPQLHKPDDQNIKELWADFLESIKTNRRSVADIEEGHLSTNMSLLAMISARTGRAINWDPAKQTILGDPAAAKLLSRPYRTPWKYPS